MNDDTNRTAPYTTMFPLLANVSAAFFKSIINLALRLDVKPRQFLADVLIKTYGPLAEEFTDQVCMYLEETASNVVLQQLYKDTAETEEKTEESKFLLKSKL